LFASLNPEQKIAVVKLIETCFLDQSGGGWCRQIGGNQGGPNYWPIPFAYSLIFW
jgi:hypothetical protein